MTEYNNNYEREFGWDDTITADSSFVILEPGEYWFKVKSYERGRYTPGPNSKLPACNKATLELEITTNTGEVKTVKHNLFLHSRTEGMLSAFFGAIGQKKHGEPLKMNWQTVPQAVGVCSIKKSLSSNGNEFNEVGYMVYADEVNPTKQLNQRPQSGAYTQPMYQQPTQQTQPMPQQPQYGGVQQWQPGGKF